jgi:hypothetical protein
LKLKCIGGLLDGYRYEVVDYYLKDDEMIQLPKPVTGLTVSSDPLKMPKEIEMPVIYYKIKCLYFSEKKNDYIYCLIPLDWSFREAMIYQFGK